MVVVRHKGSRWLLVLGTRSPDGCSCCCCCDLPLFWVSQWREVADCCNKALICFLKCLISCTSALFHISSHVQPQNIRTKKSIEECVLIRFVSLKLIIRGELIFVDFYFDVFLFVAKLFLHY